MYVDWHGVTQPGTFSEAEENIRGVLAEHARSGAWPRVFELLSGRPDLVNAWQPGDERWRTALHHAAEGGAPAEVVERLVEIGAWRTLRTSDGERAVDSARRAGHPALGPLLEPVLLRSVPADALGLVERHFHATIRQRAAELVDRWRLRLPPLEVLLELKKPRQWFPIPGMYGGFRFWLARAGPDPLPVSESWSRVVGGSGRRHAVTTRGSRLVDEGFV